MKYTIASGTPLFNELVELKHKIRAAEKEAFKIVEEVGAKTYIGDTNMYVLGGGIFAICFDKDHPLEKIKDWKAVDLRRHGLGDCRFPKKNVASNKDILNRIYNLPIVKTDELNAILNFEEQSIRISGGKSDILLHPGITFKEEIILVDVDSRAEYLPVNGMTEVLESAYKKLLELPSRNFKN